MTRVPLPPLRVWMWAAATVALVVVAALLWRGSDAAATESTTAPPADVPDETPAGELSPAWAATGDPLPEDVVEGGRIITGSASGVRGLDALTGEEAWHYTRSNARLCGLTATNGVAVAVFRTADRCDEAVALHADTGVRAWTRNVNFRADAVLDSTDRIVLATSPTGLVTLDPTGNNIRWRYAAPEGCTLRDTDVGSSGVLVLQECDGGESLQLRLLGGFEGEEHWTRDLSEDVAAEDVALVGADRPLAVRIGSRVQLLTFEDGSVVRDLPLSGETAASTVVARTALFWTGATLYAVDASNADPLWQAPAIGLPARTDTVSLAEGTDVLLVPSPDGFAQRDAFTGRTIARSTAADVPSGGVAGAVGPVVIYRVGDEVLAYR